MTNFFILYKYELKKIFKRKIVYITLVLLLLIAAYMGVAEPLSFAVTSSDGETINGMQFVAEEKANAEMVTGKIDDGMLNQIREYEGGYTGPFDPKLQQTSAVIGYVSDIMDNRDAYNSVDADTLYQTRLYKVQNNWQNQMLSESEKEYWTEKENALEKPFVYGYAKGWQTILEEVLSLNVLLILAVSICLSTVFSEEHTRKTDQLILCSKLGRKTIFFSKIASGITFGLGSAVVFFMTAMASTLFVYGVSGSWVPVQICLPECSWNITMGQAVLLMGGAYLTAAILYSAFVMFLSEALKNSIAVMGIMTGGLLLTLMVQVPYHDVLPSRIYALLPSVLLQVWQLWDNRLVSVFGMHFANFQAAPVIYLIISAGLVFWGSRMYKACQVKGR